MQTFLLHFGALSVTFSNGPHVHAIFVFLFEIILSIPSGVVSPLLGEVVWVHVGVKVRHDGEDDANPNQQTAKEKELHPLGTTQTTDINIRQDFCSPC